MNADANAMTACVPTRRAAPSAFETGAPRSRFRIFLAAAIFTSLLPGGAAAAELSAKTQIIQRILDSTQPLKFPRGNRLPLYLWPVMDVGTSSDSETEDLLRRLNDRGIAAVSTWDVSNRDKSLREALRVATLQKKLGLDVNINATACLHQFFNGDPRTAHVTEAGGSFFDSSFDPGIKMGCPFVLDLRLPAIKEQVEFFARVYRQRGLPVDFIFADWEIDGPIEWNGAWENSRRCRRCREHIRRITDFTEFQNALRTIRSELQRAVFAEPMRALFPKVRVGNYAVYPHNGYREWSDYFEKFIEGAPCRHDQHAKYRQWFHEFPLTRYTLAMPVVYTWYPTFLWYDFEEPDYRWFYNLLLVGSNAAEHTPRGVPIISFVHWHTTAPPEKPDPRVIQFSEEKYQELLWHLLLRGMEGLFLWCTTEETLKEVALLHAVYAESLEYREFLEEGEPVTFDVPRRPGPVVSCLRLRAQLLVRRTDFAGSVGPVVIKVGGRAVQIGRKARGCQIIKWDD